MNAEGILLFLVAIAGVTGADVPDIQCPADGIIFLPHETNCNLYYGCFDGDAYLMMCDPNDCFDEQSQQCIVQDSTTITYISTDTIGTSIGSSTDTSTELFTYTNTEYQQTSWYHNV